MTMLGADPKSAVFETEILDAINEHRIKKKLLSMNMDERARKLARSEAKLAVTDSKQASGVHTRIKGGTYAPHGYMLFYGSGSEAKGVMAQMLKDRNVKKALAQEEYGKAGVGVFKVQDDPIAYQVFVLLIGVPDPMLGKPGLSRAQTDPVMHKNLKSFQKCYDKALGQNPNLRGTVLLEMTIDGAGKVSSVAAKKGIGDKKAETCMEREASRLKFPKPYKGKPVVLKHPIRFSPPQGGRRLGVLSPTQIRGTFGGSSLGFSQCYDKARKTKPALKGSIVVELTVKPDGKVSGVKIGDDEINDKAMTACVLGHAKKLVFPRPKFDGEVDLAYPLRFTPGG